MIDRINGSINVIMAYNSKSTIPIPYGAYVPRTQPLPSIPSWITFSRPATAVVIMTNCGSFDRNKKLAELKKVIDIDVMGKCGTVKHKECDARLPDCFKMLAKHYLFYIALENSDCPEYITEKIWRNSFDSGMVPIVWSKVAGYKKTLPPRSYINVADFPNLAKFKIALDEVKAYPNMYQRYHEWRKNYDIVIGDPIDTGAMLCDFAHDNARKELPPIDIPAIRVC